MSYQERIESLYFKSKCPVEVIGRYYTIEISHKPDCGLYAVAFTDGKWFFSNSISMCKKAIRKYLLKKRMEIRYG